MSVSISSFNIISNKQSHGAVDTKQFPLGSNAHNPKMLPGLAKREPLAVISTGNIASSMPAKKIESRVAAATRGAIHTSPHTQNELSIQASYTYNL